MSRHPSISKYLRRDDHLGLILECFDVVEEHYTHILVGNDDNNLYLSLSNYSLEQLVTFAIKSGRITTDQVLTAIRNLSVDPNNERFIEGVRRVISRQARNETKVVNNVPEP